MKHAIERLRSSILFFPLTAVLFFLSGCGTKDATPMAGGSGGRPPAPVVVASVERRDIPVQIQAIGNVEAYQTVQIRSQVNGQIQKIFFKEGEDVSKPDFHDSFQQADECSAVWAHGGRLSEWFSGALERTRPRD